MAHTDTQNGLEFHFTVLIRSARWLFWMDWGENPRIERVSEFEWTKPNHHHQYKDLLAERSHRRHPEQENILR